MVIYSPASISRIRDKSTAPATARAGQPCTSAADTGTSLPRQQREGSHGRTPHLAAGLCRGHQCKSDTLPKDWLCPRASFAPSHSQATEGKTGLASAHQPLKSPHCAVIMLRAHRCFHTVLIVEGSVRNRRIITLFIL